MKVKRGERSYVEREGKRLQVGMAIVVHLGLVILLRQVLHGVLRCLLLHILVQLGLVGIPLGLRVDEVAPVNHAV